MLTNTSYTEIYVKTRLMFSLVSENPRCHIYYAPYNNDFHSASLGAETATQVGANTSNT